MIEIAYWYAVLVDRQDSDMGTGSYDFDEAVKILKEWHDDEDACIAQIDNGAVRRDGVLDESNVPHSDPYCEAVFDYDDIMDGVRPEGYILEE